LVLVRHLRQVLDIDVYKARRVLFEGLYRCFGAFLLGQQGLEVRHAVAAQTAVQTGAETSGG